MGDCIKTPMLALREPPHPPIRVGSRHGWPRARVGSSSYRFPKSLNIQRKLCGGCAIEVQAHRQRKRLATQSAGLAKYEAQWNGVPLRIALDTGATMKLFGKAEHGCPQRESRRYSQNSTEIDRHEGREAIDR